MLLQTIFQACRPMVLQIVKNRLMWFVLVLLVVLLLGVMFPLREVVLSAVTDPWPLFAVPPHSLVTL